MKIRNLVLHCGSFTLDLPAVDFVPGLVHGLIGPNGSGKTTLAGVIAGILVPDSGNIDPEGLGPREMTMMTQQPYLMHTTVRKNLIYPLQLRGIAPDETKIRAMAARFGLEQKLEQSARTLSSGEQQKLSFLRALIFEPKLIVVDETLSNLDPDSASLFMETIREHQRKTPVTWIIISHQLVQIRAICDRVHFMEGGRHLAEGTPEELLLHPEVPAVREFLASTEVSFGSS